MSDEREQAPALQHRIRRLRRLLFSLASGESDRIAGFEIEDDEFGKLERTLLAFVDEFVETKRRRAALEARNAEIIARQAEFIDSLAAPMIEVADGVVVVPLIGPLGGARLTRSTELLLEHISAQRVSVVMLDLSGVEEIDTSSVARIGSLCRAIRLLGARTVLTGIRPELAQALTQLDVTLEASTAASLREALRSLTTAA